MIRKLPPLTALKAFDSVARHQSFTKAAEELGVTQSAVSKQIALLEDHLGVLLLERTPRSVRLTACGKQYSESIIPAFSLLVEATGLLTGGENRENKLVINIMPSMSVYWLIPRIAAFRQAHPGLSVHINEGDGVDVDFTALNCDVAIRASQVMPIQTGAYGFMGERMYLVCSPMLLDGRPAPEEFKDLLQYDFLEHSSRPSLMQKVAKGQGCEEFSPAEIIEFEHFFMVHEAVKRGLGTALLPSFIVEADIASGHLVHLLNVECVSGYEYYALYDLRKRLQPNVKKFLKWLRT